MRKMYFAVAVLALAACKGSDTRSAGEPRVIATVAEAPPVILPAVATIGARSATARRGVAANSYAAEAAHYGRANMTVVIDSDGAMKPMMFEGHQDSVWAADSTYCKLGQGVHSASRYTRGDRITCNWRHLATYGQ